MRVVVTRPEPGLSRTMERLRREGYEPVALPLSKITALEAGVAEAGRRQSDGYVVTSAAALDATRGQLDTGRPIWVVGPATAEAARRNGFKTVIEGPGDAHGLAEAIIGEDGTAGRLLYPAGRVRMPGLEEAMSAAGLSLDVVEVYDTRPVAHDPGVLAERLGGRPAVLLYSAAAARSFRALNGADFAGSFICMSENVAAGLGDLPAGRVTIAPVPDEDSMFAALRVQRNQREGGPFTV